jgi:hypothetical protein
MSKCPGLHCSGCGSGSGSGLVELGAVGVALAVAVSVISAAVSAVLAWLSEVWPYLVAGGSLLLAGGVSLAVLVSRRRARVAVTWQLGRTALRAPQRPAPGRPVVIPGVVIRERPAGSGARRAARPLPAPVRAPAWPRTRPDGSREPR